MSANSDQQTKKGKKGRLLHRLLSRPFLSRFARVPEEAKVDAAPTTPTMPSVLLPVARSRSLLEQVEETIAGLQQAHPQTVTNANKEAIRDRLDDAYLSALEKKTMDAKISALTGSHATGAHHADLYRLGSRWSPDSTATSVSSRNAVDEIPSDEEPEICEADVTICYPVEVASAGAVEVTGAGAPALNTRQREEKARAQTENTVAGQDSSASKKTLRSKFSRSDPQLAHKKSTEPFPEYVDNFEEEQRKMGLSIPPYTSTQAWVSQHGNIKERPQSDTSNSDVLADRAIPPAPLQHSSYPTPRIPPKSPKRTPAAPKMPLRIPPPPPIPARSAYRQSNLPSPTAVPLPISPIPPFRRAPIRGKPLSPFTRLMGQPTLRTSPQTRAPPRIQLPVPAPSGLPLRSSSLPPPLRQYCQDSAHVFHPIDLNAAVSYYPTNTLQHVHGTPQCEKCGKKAEMYMRCKVPVCKLAVCFGCAYGMQEEE
ncbi:hypothetical protein P171DRAFT_472677 [Karstenula rhodostoma CBS 690.94]|uniref:Uncharacterized protein n=1 Tax=Karstenula rhodostoma CBS 690.94 TaxID=1392251 RepID=A0A9P4UCR5_9PLEO|nr:hypothetical protein P171DRAFT_472677 [Karstenula rhodostoma CBS 690.94]